MPTVRALLEKKNVSVAQVGKAQTVLEAARMMKDRHIGCLVVTEEGRVIGIFTERDILMRVVAEGREPARTTVGEIMTSPVACCHPDTTLAECIAVITEKRHRHLPVVEDGRLCGIISSGDLLAQQIRNHETTITYLQEYLHGGHR